MKQTYINIYMHEKSSEKIKPNVISECGYIISTFLNILFRISQAYYY